MAGQKHPTRSKKPVKTAKAKAKPKLGPDLAQAMEDAAIAPRDARGLVSLEPARSATTCVRGELHETDETAVTDADRAAFAAGEPNIDWRLHARFVPEDEPDE